MSRSEAQGRVKQILAFQDELSILQQGGVVDLRDADNDAIAAYHGRLFDDFAHRYDTDLTTSELQLSWGMRIASTLGAIAFSLAIFLFFDHYWNTFSTTTQVGLVSAAPFIGWGLTEIVAWRYKTPYYTSLAVLVAIACFVANLHIVGQIFNIMPSPNAFLVWGLFGLFLAYRHDLTIVMGVSLISLITFVGGFLTNLSGFNWPQVQFQEFFLGASLLCLIAPILIKAPAIKRYRYVYFFIGLLCTYSALEWLFFWPRGSLLPVSKSAVEWIYTVLAFIGAGLGVWQCIRAQWAVGTYLSAIFLVVFMLHKYFDWFWKDWPNYVFFLLLGCITIALIAFLRYVRGTLQESGR